MVFFDRLYRTQLIRGISARIQSLSQGFGRSPLAARLIRHRRRFAGAALILVSIALGTWARDLAQAEALGSWLRLHPPSNLAWKHALESRQYRALTDPPALQRAARTLPSLVDEEGSVWASADARWIAIYQKQDDGLGSAVYCLSCSGAPAGWQPLGRGWESLRSGAFPGGRLDVEILASTQTSASIYLPKITLVLSPGKWNSSGRICCKALWEKGGSSLTSAGRWLCSPCTSPPQEVRLDLGCGGWLRDLGLGTHRDRPRGAFPVRFPSLAGDSACRVSHQLLRSGAPMAVALRGISSLQHARGCRGRLVSAARFLQPGPTETIGDAFKSSSSWPRFAAPFRERFDRGDQPVARRRRSPAPVFGLTFKAWWLGDAIGDLVVAPCLLVWSLPSPAWPKGRRPLRDRPLCPRRRS